MGRQLDSDRVARIARAITQRGHSMDTACVLTAPRYSDGTGALDQTGREQGQAWQAKQARRYRHHRVTVAVVRTQAARRASYLAHRSQLATRAPWARDGAR